MTDPWQEMDDWCKRKAKTNSEAFEARFRKVNAKLDDPELRRLLGQSQAFGRMRSFIHGARNAS